MGGFYSKLDGEDLETIWEYDKYTISHVGKTKRGKDWILEFRGEKLD